MTPAETLLAAAWAIEGRLDELRGLPWKLGSDSVADELEVFSVHGEVVAALPDTRAGKAAAECLVLSPTVLLMFGEYLEDLAGDAQEMPADMRAVAIAEVVLTALGAPTE